LHNNNNKKHTHHLRQFTARDHFGDDLLPRLRPLFFSRFALRCVRVVAETAKVRTRYDLLVELA
jgi:hypothetical protein